MSRPDQHGARLGPADASRLTKDLESALQALADGRHATPFDVLGLHPADGDAAGLVARVWWPGADRIAVVRDGRTHEGTLVHPAGVFQVDFLGDSEPFAYTVSVDGRDPVRDPYTFAPIHDDETLKRVRDPTGRIHEVLGAHALEHEGAQGTLFAVWAPMARAVSVVGGFNGWSESRHPMRARGGSGVWELFVPGVAPGALYKYRVFNQTTGATYLKADPCGRAMQLRPDSASVVPTPTEHVWGDAAWLRDRAGGQTFAAPLSIYEVHVGSWRRKEGAAPRAGEPGWKSYRELADELVPYVADLGFTHIELLPVTEHPYDGSWGYQTIGYFAPSSRYGSADDLRYLVDRAHQAGVGVILDWVPAHFPKDRHGLGLFDGTHLYEHADPRKGVHPDWGTYIFNLGRAEVVSFLVSSALYWIESFHFDGLRLDAVASMLYLDYSRDEGAWVPNQFGGRENIEATRFLRLLNETVHEEHPGVLMTAEESTAWPGVTHPASQGGLGFDVKWNMGWMHDTLEVAGADPLFRKGLYDRLTFGITYAFAERFLLAFSHDEVVHLKRSMLRKMPGTTLDRFANLRLLYGYMWAHPGKKLLFMGGELAVWDEWDVEGELDWALLEEPMHAGMRRWVSELNALYSARTELHATDGDGRGFEWLDCHDRDRTTLAFLRWSPEWRSHIAVVTNFARATWEGYRLALPAAGRYEVLLCSDDRAFGGSGALETRVFETTPGELHGRDQYIELSVPPLSAIFFALVAPE